MYPRPAPTAWNLDPVLLLALALLLGGYFLVIGPLRRRVAPDEPTPPKRIAYYLSGWVALALTLITPLDTLGRSYLFLAHTAQLFLLTTLIAPLLMSGVPEWLVMLLLPTRSLRNATRGLLFPILCTVAFNAIILIWHIGALYEPALRDPALHNLQMLSFLLAGVLTWWPLLTPLDRHTRMATPFQMLYLALESLPLDIFGAIVIFAPGVFYSTYATAPRLFGLSALADQQIAGAILAVPGNVIDIVLMSVIFFAWITRMERAQRARERIQYGDDDIVPEGTAPAITTDEAVSR
jgi:putative membrane protein